MFFSLQEVKEHFKGGTNKGLFIIYCNAKSSPKELFGEAFQTEMENT